MAEKKDKNLQPGIKVTTKREGLRRGDREWRGTIELPLDALTETELKQVEAEPLLVTEWVDLEIKKVED